MGMAMVSRVIAVILLLIVLIAASPTPRPEPTVVGVGVFSVTERQLLNMIRDARRDHIPTSPLLMRVAEKRAWDITTDYSHHGAGVPGISQWGEILNWNAYPANLTIGQTVDAWKESAGHDSVLMGNWTHIGVGIAQVDYKYYYAVVFANIYTGKIKVLPTLPPTDTE